MIHRPYTTADALIDTLIKHGVSTMFGYPGGAVLPFYDALSFHPKLRHILVRHEQGAAFAAQGWARTTGQIGVCVATSGPGGTNLITGIADAYMDSIPMLAITGQVPLETIGKDMFQETDMTGVTLNITKHNYLVERAEDIVPIITEAIHIATSGRPGPVHIDLPKNIMAADHPRSFVIPKVDFSQTDPTVEAYKKVPKTTLDEAIKLLKQAKKPIMLVGHGVKLSGGDELADKLVRHLQIPAVTTLLGKGVLDIDNPYYLGMLGMHGFYHANLAVHEADLIFNIGSRFDDRIVGRYDSFAKNAKIIHVDIDQAELNKVVSADLPIHSDAAGFLTQILERKDLKPLKTDKWLAQIDEWKSANEYERRPKEFTMRTCLDDIAKVVAKNPDQYILVTDVGQHQMWSSLSCVVKKSSQWLTSGGAGTMGFGLPTAVGAAIANPDKTVICITGDGGIQMNIQELEVIAQHKLNIKVIIMNNAYLGMVRQWQELFYGRNYSYVNITSPDFVKIADAYRLKGERASNEKAFQKQLSCLTKKGPIVLEAKVKQEDNTFPMVPGGKTLGETITEA